MLKVSNVFDFTRLQSLALRKVMANRTILEPVVEEASSLIHDAEFTNLVKEIGFLRKSWDEDKPENPSPPKVIFKNKSSFFVTAWKSLA